MVSERWLTTTTVPLSRGGEGAARVRGASASAARARTATGWVRMGSPVERRRVRRREPVLGTRAPRAARAQRGGGMSAGQSRVAGRGGIRCDRMREITARSWRARQRSSRAHPRWAGDACAPSRRIASVHLRPPCGPAAVVRGPTFQGIRPSQRAMSMRPVQTFMVVVWLALLASQARAATPQPGPPLTIGRAQGAITIDGDLADAGWQGVAGVTQWYETRVGDSVEPHLKNVAYLAYDDKYFYAGFRFEDPNPKSIRAPLGDHDALSGTTDYGGIIVDSRNDGKTAQMFLANASGLQYDAISSDVTGEDSSPDYFWDTAGKITETGWNLEIRVPFSSLRYASEAAPTWGILLYRNYPRERHYQFFTARLPRDVTCFICNSSKLTGLSELPHGSHLVLAPFATSERTAVPTNGLGSKLTDDPLKSTAGLDVKWSPLSGLAIDGTLNPDFSQVEADAAQIVANERFALFFPEKRSFFLEGVDLFATPFQAVYTRTITQPGAGLRATGRSGKTAFTALVSSDEGGGLVIIPGPQGSDFADQDFHSTAGIVRMRRDFGPSFVSALATFREIEGGAYNRVLGPDFQWRPTPSHTFTGQALWSKSLTPDRQDLADEWDGRTLEDHALRSNYQYVSPRLDAFVEGSDLGPEFRADNGFIPQVGFREVYGQVGLTFRPKDFFFSRIRCFGQSFLDEEQDGTTLQRNGQLGIGADGRWASFWRVEYNYDEIRVGNELIPRTRPRVQIDASPWRWLGNLSFVGTFGDEIDFDNGRPGTGANLSLSGTWRPDFHTAVALSGGVRWLDVDAGTAGSGRLFTAQVERLRGTYMLNARTFVRLIVQHVQTTRDPALYTFTVDSKTAGMQLSGLFAYKLNWQTVLYLGYGDQQEYLDTTGQLEKSGQQAFAKVSYAWQL